MEKISSILPSSSRIKSVDLTEAPPARPGAPTVGRSEGRNSIRDRITLSERAKDLALQDTLAFKNPKETARAKMVEEVSKKFFETRLNTEPTTTEKVVESTEEYLSQPVEQVDTSVAESAPRLDIEA